MAHKKKNRNVGIIGIGQTKHSSHREDVNQPELIHEAVSLALKDANLTMKDIDCVVHGNMELFEMVHSAGSLACAGYGRLRERLYSNHHGRNGRGNSVMRLGQPCSIGNV